jgi:hypothetical protein
MAYSVQHEQQSTRTSTACLTAKILQIVSQVVHGSLPSMGKAVNAISCMRFANVCYCNAGWQLTLIPIWRPLPTSPLYDRAKHDHPMLLVALQDIPVHFCHGELLYWRKSVVRLYLLPLRTAVNKRLTLGAWSIPDRCTHNLSGGNIKKYMSHTFKRIY